MSGALVIEGYVCSIRSFVYVIATILLMMLISDMSTVINFCWLMHYFWDSYRLLHCKCVGALDGIYVVQVIGLIFVIDLISSGCSCQSPDTPSTTIVAYFMRAILLNERGHCNTLVIAFLLSNSYTICQIMLTLTA